MTSRSHSAASACDTPQVVNDAGRGRLPRWLVLLLSFALSPQSPIARAQGAEGPLQIDLPTALRLADERNLDVAIYYERVAAATAALSQARLLAVPTLRVGSSYDSHEGRIQETSGNVIEADRASRFVGAGASVGIDVSDAIYRPLAARQSLEAVRAAAVVSRHQTLVDVATAYLRLLQARAEAGVIDGALERAQDLAALTASYAEAGEGLVADLQLAAVQPLVWQQRQLGARENIEIATATVTQLLHLEPGVAIEPMETSIPALELFAADDDVESLVLEALERRPEGDQLDALVAAAEEDVKEQRFGLFLPNVSLSYNTGDFGGAPGSDIANTGGRNDLSVQLYWQFEALGFGHRARLDAKRAQLREVGLQREKLRDAITAQVRSAYASTESRRGQLPLADAAVQRAADAYELHRERIYDQQGLPLEALAAMQMLATAELARIDAVTSYDLAQIRLHTALGNPLAGGL